jgi:cell division protease FtsH
MDFETIEDIDEMEFEEDEEGSEITPTEMPEFIRTSRNIRKKNHEKIRSFLGKGRQEQVSVIRPRFYSGLLAWAIKHYIEQAKWKTVKVIGRNAEAPDYSDVPTDYEKQENALTLGYLLLERDNSKVVLSVRIRYDLAASVLITSTSKKIAKEVAKGIENMAQGKNLYHGKKLELNGSIDFLKLPKKNWADLALDPLLKDEIRRNTVDFLNRKEEFGKYGIPFRRGVMLSGEPGTGKTLINKIVMNESCDITCISAVPGNLVHTSYIRELYKLARDLKPSMVFMEDIDLVGENRRMSKGPVLPQLLAELDGVEECTDIVTIATTNFIENIDDALRKRPSRFDRIIQIPLPSLEQRREFVNYLANKIPMADDIKEYMACRTENMTPAQIQEMAYSLVIEHEHVPKCAELGCCQFSKNDVDKILPLVNGERRGRELGFMRAGSNGGNSLGIERLRILNSESEHISKKTGGDNNV